MWIVLQASLRGMWMILQNSHSRSGRWKVKLSQAIKLHQLPESTRLLLVMVKLLYKDVLTLYRGDMPVLVTWSTIIEFQHSTLRIILRHVNCTCYFSFTIVCIQSLLSYSAAWETKYDCWSIEVILFTYCRAHTHGKVQSVVECAIYVFYFPYNRRTKQLINN